jgi:hypothetical protein
MKTYPYDPTTGKHLIRKTKNGVININAAQPMTQKEVDMQCDLVSKHLEETKAATIFVKFICGCVGIPVDQKYAIIVHPCDGEGDICFCCRDMEDKDYTYMEASEGKEYVKKIGSLIADGHDLRQVKAVLNRRTQ